MDKRFINKKTNLWTTSKYP